jgi:hypothetical protein
MVVDHFDRFVSGYDSRFRATHGRLRTETENAFLSFQRCGDPNFGVILFRCDTCDVKLGVPFSCKSRICPSCLARKAEERSIQLSENVPSVDHRHIVIGFPKKMGLRQRIQEDPQLLRKLTRLVNQELSNHLLSCIAVHRRRREELKNAKPGIIVAQHTWADNLDYHHPLRGYPPAHLHNGRRFHQGRRFLLSLGLETRRTEGEAPSASSQGFRALGKAHTRSRRYHG